MDGNTLLNYGIECGERVVLWSVSGRRVEASYDQLRGILREIEMSAKYARCPAVVARLEQEYESFDFSEFREVQ